MSDLRQCSANLQWRIDLIRKLASSIWNENDALWLSISEKEISSGLEADSDHDDNDTMKLQKSYTDDTEIDNDGDEDDDLIILPSGTINIMDIDSFLLIFYACMILSSLRYVIV